jgi:hypothetical protein
MMKVTHGNKIIDRYLSALLASFLIPWMSPRAYKDENVGKSNVIHAMLR